MKHKFALTVLGILAIMLIRGDGFFPFLKSWPKQLLLFLVLIHTVLLVSLICYACYKLIKPDSFSKKGVFLVLQPVLVAVSPFFLICISAVLHLIQWKRFQQFGYQFSFMGLCIFILLSMMPLAIYWFIRLKHRSIHSGYYLISILVSSLILKIFPLVYFPVTAKRSDMLPILYEAASSFINGQAIYKSFLLDNGLNIPNVRLPGLILSFVPAVIFDFDLRIINLIFEGVIFGSIIYLIGRLKEVELKETGLILTLICFILFPYWHFRHELYEVPFWMLLFFTLYSLYRNRLIISSILIGFMCATHQWGWLFTPYLLIYVQKNWKWKKTLLGSLVVLCIMLLTVLSIHRHDSIMDFYHSVLGTYDTIIANKDFYPMSMYLSAIMAHFNLESYLHLIQILSQVVILIFAIKFTKTLISLIGFLALSLTFMLLFNPVTWTYQYLLVVFLLILGLLFSSIINSNSNIQQGII